jgi:hypothetical protein
VAVTAAFSTPFPRADNAVRAMLGTARAHREAPAMPLHVPPAQPAALRSVLAALRSPSPARAAHRGRTPVVPDSSHGPLELELPLPLHELAPISRPVGSPPSRLAGWRFLLRATDAPAGSAPVGAAEAVLTPDGWTFAYFSEGPYVTSTQRALKQAESLTEPFQPRLLSVPQLYMLTLWLHTDTGADAAEGTPQPSDLLIPLAPAPPGITAHRAHRVDALLPLLTRRVVTTPLLRTPG